MMFEAELVKLGLSDKAASVYLSCLELGPSPVQQIARKSKVVRATTYVVLESLMNQGLVTQYKEGKKTMFAAEPPRQLLRLLEQQREVVEDKERQLSELLPQLQVLMKGVSGNPTVRYFAGREGLRAIRQEIVRYVEPGDVVLNFTPADHLVAAFPDNDDAYFQQRVAKKIFARTIFTTRSASLKRRWLQEDLGRYSERRFIPPDIFPSTAVMTVYRDRIAFGSYAGKQMGAVIESPVIADMMRNLFDLAWISAEKVDSGV